MLTHREGAPLAISYLLSKQSSINAEDKAWSQS
jgi:hypothetical protein